MSDLSESMSDTSESMRDLSELTVHLRTADAGPDDDAWPAKLVDLLRDSQCFAQVVPEELGGVAASKTQRLIVYEAVAAGSLTAALILTQHDAAGELLAGFDGLPGGENSGLRRDVLSHCARGEALLTVGISQLTTAVRPGGPTLRADPVADGFRLDGFMPWVTSAGHADYVVTGAQLSDGRQILACVAMDASGIEVADSYRLMALSASCTARIHCHAVHVGSAELVRGPVPDVLARRAAVKPLTVTFVGLGMADALMDEIRQCAAGLPDGASTLEDVVEERYRRLRAAIHEAAHQLDAKTLALAKVRLRVAVNDLVVRLAATLMTLSKGSGFVAGHRAQQLLRESAFFLVWSAPRDVQVETIRRLWTGHDDDPAGFS